MSKIKVKSLIYSNEGEREEMVASAIKNDNKIYFKINDANFFIELLPHQLVLVKEDNDKRMKLFFEQNKRLRGECTVYEPSVMINIETFTKVLKINDDGIEVLYELKMNGEYSDTFTYQLTWEVNDEHHKRN